jgi:hypothetical protein
MGDRSRMPAIEVPALPDPGSRCLAGVPRSQPMKHFSAIPLAFVLFFALAAVSAGRASERRALLIGINDYASPSLLKLRGALNDMELVAEVLKKQFDFPAANLTILRDEQASREAILAAIQQLVAESGPNDFLYIHFSGHGAQVEDFDGDEEDGMDETLVAQDSRTEGVPDILDDEISALIEPLASRAVMVVDACHSGTITRGEISVAQLEGQAVIPRSAPPDPRLDLYRDRSVAKRGIGTPALEERLVLMTGAANTRLPWTAPWTARSTASSPTRSRSRCSAPGRGRHPSRSWRA